MLCQCVCNAGTYIPRKEVTVSETVQASIIRPNQAIKLRARKECIDREGSVRVTGEEWLVKKTGAYLPGAYEEVVDVVNAYVLTEKVCIHHIISYFVIPLIKMCVCDWFKSRHVV